MERVCPKCSEKDKEIDNLNKKIVDLKFYIDDLKESEETYKNKISELCKQLEKEKDRYNQLKEEKGSDEISNKRINELSIQLEKEKERYNQLKNEKNSYDTSSIQITELNKKLEKENNQLKAQNESLNNRANDLQKSVNQLVDQVFRLQKELRNQSNNQINNRLANKRFFPIPNYQGCSIVDALNSIGFEHRFEYRKKIANANGIGNGNYTGKPIENGEMLRLLLQGSLVIPSS